jgi:mannosidase alpha-like ER degradation enhancer 2
MWEASIPAVNKYLADEIRGDLWYGHTDMQTGEPTKTTYGALDAFFPGLLALSGDLERARRLQASSFKMWNLHGIEPETLDYKTMRVLAGSYHLRPEIVESTYYLYHYTGDPDYRRMGEKTFDDFVKYCRPTLATPRLRTWSPNNSSMKCRASSWPRPSNISIYSSRRLKPCNSIKLSLIPKRIR